MVVGRKVAPLLIAAGLKTLHVKTKSNIHSTEKNTKPLKESLMFAEVLNEFNYTKTKREIKKINAEITQNSNVDRSLETQVEDASFNTTSINTSNVNPVSN